MKIKYIRGREIFDSRAYPTVQCEITLEDGSSVQANAPVGKSRSRYEAVERRDGGARLQGLGVLHVAQTIEQKIAPILVGRRPTALEMDLQLISLDGTMNKTNLGANVMLAVSMALFKAQALVEQMELYEFIAYVLGLDTVSLPFPWFNMINGGAHVAQGLPIQEFLVIPVANATFKQAFEAGVTIFWELGHLLEKKTGTQCIGDEGGYAPLFNRPEQALDLIMEAFYYASQQTPMSCVIALDVAASQLYDKKTGLYHFGDRYLESAEMIAYYEDLLRQYPIYAIEDGLDQDDWLGWQKFVKLCNQKAQIVGDDITATSIEHIARAIEEQACTSVIIKPNQIGTITETLQAIQICKEYGVNPIISARSGETCDTFIADLAVGSHAGQIKAGNCNHSERIAKYNRLLTIEEQLTFNLLQN